MRIITSYQLTLIGNKMILTKKLLIQWNACEEGIDFCQRNKLFGFDLSRIVEIKGDYNNFMYWLKKQLKITREYDSNGNVIKDIFEDGDWYSYEYDIHGNCIKKNNFKDHWIEWEYDEHGNQIKQEDFNRNWTKWEYDSQHNKIKEEKSNGYWIKLQYDHNNNLISEQNLFGEWYTYQYNQYGCMVKKESFDELYLLCEYDEHLNLIKVTNRYETKITETEYYPNGQLKQIGNLKLPLI